jgi:cell wall assembly regulator SMI1
MTSNGDQATLEAENLVSTASNEILPESDMAMTAQEVWVSLKFTHAGKEYTVDLADSDR